VSASGPQTGEPPAARHLVRAWAAWWGVCAALWLALVDRTEPAELVTGAVVAAMAATAAVLVRRRRPVLLRLPAGVAARAARAAAGQLTDLPLLVRVLARRGVLRADEHGTLLERPFPFTRPDEPRDAGERVVAQTLGSLAPARVVVDVDIERGVILEHRLEGP
jgi:hypothetical protein